MKKIKIAQIGVGHDHAADVITTLKLQSDIYDLVGYAVVLEDSGNLDQFSYKGMKEKYENVKKMSVEEILNYPDLDAVCIETEDRALTKYAILAAEKGLNIHMDKPGGIENEDFDKLIDLVREKNLVFHTGYMYRYNPAIMKLKEDIKAGKLGEIYAVEAQMNILHIPQKRQWLGNYPGGMLYFLGCHLIDFIYSVMGEPKEIVPLSMPIHTDDVTAQDFGMAIFKYENGISFAKSTAVEVGGFERRQIVVCGTKGTVEIKPTETFYASDLNMVATIKSNVTETIIDSNAVERSSYETDVFGRYDGMFKAFASYVRREKENPYTYEYERNLHKIILKACGKEVL